MPDPLVDYNVSLQLNVFIDVPDHNDPPEPPPGYYWNPQIRIWIHHEVNPTAGVSYSVHSDVPTEPLWLVASFSQVGSWSFVGDHLIRYQLTKDSGEPQPEFWEEKLRNAVLTVLNVDQYGNLSWGCYGEGTCCCAELVANA
ncbi:MAG: hypothetical protein HYU66_22345 [Armatimonadetes bacterium]|nr:hypothetical protein [Armatimonadota bacterium]